MSDAVTVGLIAASGAVLSSAFAALMSFINHRKREAESRETRAAVGEIHVLVNGSMAETNRRLTETTRLLAEAQKTIEEFKREILAREAK